VILEAVAPLDTSPITQAILEGTSVGAETLRSSLARGVETLDVPEQLEVQTPQIAIPVEEAARRLEVALVDASIESGRILADSVRTEVSLPDVNIDQAQVDTIVGASGAAQASVQRLAQQVQTTLAGAGVEVETGGLETLDLGEGIRDASTLAGRSLFEAIQRGFATALGPDGRLEIVLFDVPQPQIDVPAVPERPLVEAIQQGFTGADLDALRATDRSRFVRPAVDAGRGLLAAANEAGLTISGAITDAFTRAAGVLAALPGTARALEQADEVRAVFAPEEQTVQVEITPDALQVEIQGIRRQFDDLDELEDIIRDVRNTPPAPVIAQFTVPTPPAQDVVQVDIRDEFFRSIQFTDATQIIGLLEDIKRGQDLQRATEIDVEVVPVPDVDDPLSDRTLRLAPDSIPEIPEPEISRTPDVVTAEVDPFVISDAITEALAPFLPTQPPEVTVPLLPPERPAQPTEEQQPIGFREVEGPARFPLSDALALSGRTAFLPTREEFPRLTGEEPLPPQTVPVFEVEEPETPGVDPTPIATALVDSSLQAGRNLKQGVEGATTPPITGDVAADTIQDGIVRGAVVGAQVFKEELLRGVQEIDLGVFPVSIEGLRVEESEVFGFDVPPGDVLREFLEFENTPEQRAFIQEAILAGAVGAPIPEPPGADTSFGARLEALLPGIIGTIGGTLVGGGGRGAQIGATVLGAAGSFLGPIGGALGGVVGGFLGGLFDDDEAERAQAQIVQLQAIERAQKETIQTIEAQTDALLSPEGRLLNLPSTFNIPNQRPDAIGGGGTGGTVVFDFSGANFGNATAAEIAEAVEGRVMNAILSGRRSTNRSVRLT
jgi:hypothetical protein